MPSDFKMLESLEQRCLLSLTPVFESVGSKGSFPRDFASAGAVYFTADSAGEKSYRELWAIDKGLGDVNLIAKYRTGNPDDDAMLTPFTGKIGYVLDLAGGTRQVFVLDEATKVATQVTNYSYSAVSIDNLHGVGNYLYFTANSTSAGRELWRTDGTVAGTTRIDTAVGGQESGGITDIHVAGDNIFFSAKIAGEMRLCVSNGQTGDSQVLMGTGIQPSPAAASDTKYYFVRSGEESATLWESGGTPETTQPAFGLTTPLEMVHVEGFGTAVGDGIVVYGAPTSKTALTVYFANKDGFVQLADNGTVGRWYDRPFFSAGGFAVSTFAGFSQIYITNGQVSGTVIADPENAGSVVTFTSDGASAYYIFTTSAGYGVYRSTGLNVEKLGDIPFKRDVWGKDTITVSDGKLWFTGYTDADSEEPMVFDLATGTSSLVADLNTTPQSNFVEIAGEWKNRAIISRRTDTNGWEVLISNGFADQTQMLMQSSQPMTDMVDLGDKFLIFCGANIYVSDGTFAGTTLIGPTFATALSASYATPDDLAVLDGVAYFAAKQSSSTGTELWRSDGTTAGTYMIADINVGLASSNPTCLTAFKDRIYFFAHTPTNGRELYSTNGLPGDVQLLREFVPGPAGGVDQISEGGLFVAGDRLLIKAYDPVVGVEIWTSDGTPENTVLLQDLSPRTDKSFADYPRWQLAGDYAFFSLYEEFGYVLYRLNLTTDVVEKMGPATRFQGMVVDETLYYLTTVTDESSQGNARRTLWKVSPEDSQAQIVRSWMRAHRSADVEMLGAWNGRVYFGMTEPATGAEIWSSDGTSGGTRREEDYLAGAEDSLPTLWLPMESLVLTTLRGVPDTKLFRYVPASSAPSPTGKISGSIYIDGNRSGNRDRVETDIPPGDFYVVIDANHNNFADYGELMTLVDSNGNYQFTGLSDGDYKLLITRHITTKSFASVNVAFFATISGGSTVSGLDIGVAYQYLTYVYDDLDAGGVFDMDEPGIPGAILYIDNNNNGQRDQHEVTATTDARGVAEIGVPSSSTLILRQILPSDWVETSPVAGFALAMEQEGALAVPLSFGRRQVAANASISGTVFSDANANSILDAGDSKLSRVVFLDTDNDGKLDSGEISQTSAADGTYKFDHLAPGTYRVRRVLPSGYKLSNPARDYILTGTETITGADIGAVTSSTVVKPPVVPPPPPPPPPPSDTTGVIKGTVFNDNNANGVFDSGDGANAGKVVFLDANGNDKLDSGEKTATSGSDGSFTFSNLAPGNYSVRRTIPSGYKYSNTPVNVTLTSGQIFTDANIGSVKSSVTVVPPGPTPPPPPPPPSGETGSISGYTFYDSNRNGRYDTGEGYLKGKTVFIDLDNDNILDSNEKKLTTDSNGRFTFTGLLAGTYHIKRTVPSGYKITTAPQTVVLSAGQVFSTVAIGINT